MRELEQGSHFCHMWSPMIFTLPSTDGIIRPKRLVREQIKCFALCEDRTHDLQIMRLTRYLLRQKRGIKYATKGGKGAKEEEEGRGENGRFHGRFNTFFYSFNLQLSPTFESALHLYGTFVISTASLRPIST